MEQNADAGGGEAVVVERVVKPMKTQEESVVKKETVVETKEISVAAAQHFIVVTEAVAEDAKIDTQAIANSVAKIMKAPIVEAANAPGAWGAY
ncbi:hypothetical protein PI126_g23966 [Phytophthora idaei]|nr:hypothetical protein PI126_g23966 [Phytophthora idaei]